MGNVQFDILDWAPSGYRYKMEWFNNGNPAADKEIDIPAVENTGYDSESFRDDSDDFALTVAEGIRAGLATTYGGGPWTAVVTRSYLANNVVNTGFEPEVLP